MYTKFLENQLILVQNWYFSSFRSKFLSQLFIFKFHSISGAYITIFLTNLFVQIWQ